MSGGPWSRLGCQRSRRSEWSNAISSQRLERSVVIRRSCWWENPKKKSSGDLERRRGKTVAWIGGRSFGCRSESEVRWPCSTGRPWKLAPPSAPCSCDYRTEIECTTTSLHWTSTSALFDRTISPPFVLSQAKFGLGDSVSRNECGWEWWQSHLFGGWKFTAGWNRRHGTERRGLQGERYIGSEINHLSSQMDWLNMWLRWARYTYELLLQRFIDRCSCEFMRPIIMEDLGYFIFAVCFCILRATVYIYYFNLRLIFSQNIHSVCTCYMINFIRYNLFCILILRTQNATLYLIYSVSVIIRRILFF